MTVNEVRNRYLSFFKARGHTIIPSAPIVPENDPTTLFTSSGMQPLVPYFLGEGHPSGKRLVNVQNCFRAVDIDEVGDNRHTTFFRMLGNWSLGDPASPGEDASQGGYFKDEEIPWLWEFLTKELGLPKENLYITVFEGVNGIPFDEESKNIWIDLLSAGGSDPKERIYAAGVDKNWWSRSGVPANMPEGEIGGPDTEVYYKFDRKHDAGCKGSDPTNCNCGVFLEIANSVFIQYQKLEDGSFKELSQKNVDFGGGLERLLAAVENKSDIFETSLFTSILQSIEVLTRKKYMENQKNMRIIIDHFIASVFIANADIKPSNKEQGYVLRRLIRRGFDNFYAIRGKNIVSILETIVETYSSTDNKLDGNFEEIKNTILEEEQRYKQTLMEAEKIISASPSPSPSEEIGDELLGSKEITAEEAFKMYSTHGLSPTQIKSLGYSFNDQEFAELMKKHQETSRAGAKQKFAGGLADTSEKTIMGHTATHLLHQALRDVLGDKVHQTGSNITQERLRFDFNYDKALTTSEIDKVELIINEKVKENLPVHFEMIPLDAAKKIGAIGLFDEKYQDKVKVYFIGNYSKEF